MNGLGSPQETFKPGHAYTSSEESDYGQIHSLSRSESGTSQTHYDEIIHDPAPKHLMDDYIRDDFDVDRPRQDGSGFRKSRTFDGADPMAMHLLLETAVDDSQQYEILSPEQLDRLKKEEASIDRKVETLKRKLYLESKVRNAAQSVGRLNGKQPSSDELADSTQKCEEMAQELLRLERQKHGFESQRLRHTAAVLQMDHQKQKSRPSNAQTNGWRNSDEWGTGFGMMPLADTEDGIMDLPGASGSDKVLESKIRGLNESFARLLLATGHVDTAPRPDAPTEQHLAFLEEGLNTLQEETDKLWDIIESSAEERRQRTLQVNDAVRDAADEHGDEPFTNEPFSFPTFSAKVQRLCAQATTLHDKQYSLREQLATEQGHLADEREVSRSHEAEKDNLGAEVARLQTEVTIARAELDGAGGTRAQRAAEESVPRLEQEIREATSRNGDLTRELQELVNEHEALVKQGVESERERENLENQVDSLRDKVETLEVRLNEERVRMMGVPLEGSKQSTSMGVMRDEFKKMMREARSEHFRGLRVSHPSPRRGARTCHLLMCRRRPSKKNGVAWRRSSATSAKNRIRLCRPRPPSRPRPPCRRRRSANPGSRAA